MEEKIILQVWEKGQVVPGYDTVRNNDNKELLRILASIVKTSKENPNS